MTNDAQTGTGVDPEDGDQLIVRLTLLLEELQVQTDALFELAARAGTRKSKALDRSGLASGAQTTGARHRR